MSYALFLDKDRALRHRQQMGGWIAIDGQGRYHWFDVTHTPTAVITSEQLRGCCAKLI